MPLNLDTYHPHPQLRYTVRLRYICPIYGEQITDYIFMSGEEHEDETSYQRILEGKKHELNTLVYDGDEKIEEWESITEIENTFYESEILSDVVLCLLKEGKVSFADESATEEDIKLAVYYLYSIKDQYSRARVKKEIDGLSFQPLKHIIDAILSVWHTSTKMRKQKNGKVETKWTKQDQELSQLLSERDKDAVSTFRKDLIRLNKMWGLSTEEDHYRRAVIIAKFLCDYPGTKGLNAGFSEGMRILCDYFRVPQTTYKKRVLIPSLEVLETLTKSQRAFQEQIREPWREFIRKF